jgi:F-type H+-transporting ATPase subunit b
MSPAILLLAHVEEGPPPLIDLDLTIVLQFALFLTMFIILSRVLFKPFFRLRDERDKAIGGALAEARGMEERVRQLASDYDARMLSAKLRGNEERSRLRVEAATRERQVLSAARAQSQSVVDAERLRIRTETESARRTLESEATSLARMLARRIIGREVG